MKKFSQILSVLFLLTGCAFWTFPAMSAEPVPSDDSSIRLFCLNVGKADCMLLWVEDKTYLIDTGYEQTWPALETALREFSISHLDGVFLTHAHRDHEGGLEALAQGDITVDAWYAARIYYDVKPQKHPMYKAAAIQNKDVIWLSAGDVISISENAAFQVLGPLSVNTDNENNNSLVMKLITSDGSILFTGDMKEEEEQELLLNGAFTACDLLKVAHHGDNKTTSQAMLSRVKPDAAIISTSSIEEPDTPASDTLQRLKAAGADIYISQDSQDAWLFNLANGNVLAEDYRWKNAPTRIKGIRLTMDLRSDILTLQNTSSENVTLSGTYLYSSKGNDVFELPEITLPAGGLYTIGSQRSDKDCDFIAQKKRIWHEEDRDVALLYDAYGRILAGTDNGLTE